MEPSLSLLRHVCRRVEKMCKMPLGNILFSTMSKTTLATTQRNVWALPRTGILIQHMVCFD
jgi:hypothetical protein